MKKVTESSGKTKKIDLKRISKCLAYSAAIATTSSSSLAETATFSPPQSISGRTDVIETWGVSSVDVNNDYCADLFFGNHRLEPSLYVGNCDGTFESRPDLIVGDNADVDAHTTIFADFQNTGCAGAHISVGGTSPTQPNHANQVLFGEQAANGDCTGRLVRQVGADAEYPEQRARSSVALDVDYDGDLDLVTTGYLIDSKGLGGNEAIFLNDGTGDLVRAPDSLASDFGGHGLTVFNIFANIDGDNELDLLCGESVFPNARCSKDVRASLSTGRLLSTDVSLDIVRNGGSQINLVVDAFAEDIDGDGDNDLVALRRGIRSGNAARRDNNQVVEGLNTTSSHSPSRCLVIPGRVDIESFDITGDYLDSHDIKFGATASSRDVPNDLTGSARRFSFGALTRAANSGLTLPDASDGVDENERGTYIGYMPAERAWRICDFSGYEPQGVTVLPSPQRRYNKFGFRIKFSGPVGELVHEGYSPDKEPLTPVVWINKGDNGNGTVFENEPLNGDIRNPITAFGLGKGDFDNDGDIDFIASYENHSARGKHYLFTNDGKGRFDRSRFSGCPTGIAESVAVADVNSDGRLDPIISCAWFGLAHKTNHAHSVWLNNTDNKNRAIMFSLQGDSSNRGGIGARVRVTDANDRTKTVCKRDVGNTLGRGSQDSEFIHCGVAKRSKVDVIIDWPGGSAPTIYDNLKTAAFYRLDEGSNSPVLVKNLGSNVNTDRPNIEVSHRRVNEDAGTAMVLVRLEGDEPNETGQAIEVDYTTVNGTAKAGQDYGRVSGRAILAPGRRFFPITVPIVNSGTTEPSERFRIKLSNASGAVINNAGGVIQIDDLN